MLESACAEGTTVLFALLGAFLLSLTLIAVLASLILRGEPEHEPLVLRRSRAPLPSRHLPCTATSGSRDRGWTCGALIGGLISSPLLTLLVLPTVYGLVRDAARR